MRRDTGRFHTTLDTVTAIGWVTAAVVASVLLAIAVLHINLDQPSPLDLLLIVGALGGPLLGFGLLYILLLERIAFYWALDRNLEALLHQVEWEIAEAHKYRRQPYHITDLCYLAVRLAPEHATTKKIQSLVQEASRQTVATDGTMPR